MKKKFSTLNSGDINFVAAMMTKGIPLDFGKPCTMVIKETGNYARFHLMSSSIDGKLDANSFAAMWKSPANCTDENYSYLMQFISYGRSAFAKVTDEWFTLAHQWLKEMKIGEPHAPVKVDDIDGFVKVNQGTIAGHVFAFVSNRKLAWDLLANANRQVMMSRGTSHVAMDTNLPSHQKRELLSRLEG